MAYLNHDIADTVRAGILKVTDLPKRANRILGTTHSQRINFLVTGIVRAAWPDSGLAGEPPEAYPVIGMEPEAREAVMELRDYMFQHLYLPLGETRQSEVAGNVVKLLYHFFVEIPPPYFRPGVEPERAAVGYVPGMTNHCAIHQAETLRLGITQGTFSNVPLG